MSTESTGYVTRWCLPLACLLVGVVPLAAQQVEAQAIQLPVAEFLNRIIPGMSSFGERSGRTLMASPLRFRIDGTKLVEMAQPRERAAEVIRELATALDAAVATPADTIRCSPSERQCYGTEGLQIRLGDPEVRGDSATVLFSLEFRGLAARGELTTHRPTVLYATYLVREAGQWRPVAYSGADLRSISRPHPIGADGMPVKRPAGGG